MPSLQQQQSYKFSGKVSKTFLFLLCSSILAACGGGSGTTRQNIDEPTPTPPKTEVKLKLSVTMPMYINNAHLRISVIGENKPIYENNNFTGSKVTLDELNSKQYQSKIVFVELSGNDKTRMYDPILNAFAPFNGTMHAISPISNQLNLFITPTSEAVYQRTIVRSSQFNFQNPDLSLVNAKHISKANTEVAASVHNAFVLSNNANLQISNLHNLSTIKYDTDPKNYTQLFIGLGFMQYIKDKYPQTKNTYLELAQNIGVDLRDGYFDGRTLLGDKTVFTPIIQAPKNTNPLNNTLLKIGAQQKQPREEFAVALKDAILNYATLTAFQNTYNPDGVKYITNMVEFIPKREPLESQYLFRWLGAGDYRPAFGLKTLESCSNGLNPCRQGLNVDDLNTYVNDAEYLIGTHQFQQCTVHFYPSGDVSITRGNKIYRSSINRDLSDNLQQLNNDPTHYILNVGASENKPAYFLQFEIKEMQIVKARTGYNHDIYSTTLETPEMDCSN